MRALRLGSVTPRLRQLVLNPDWSRLQQSDLDRMLRQPPTPGAPPLVPAGRGPATPRAGEAGDVAKAFWKVPLVQTAANQILDQVSRRAERDWNRMSGAQRALVITQTVIIGGGAIAGIMSNRQARGDVLNFLSGRDLPVPGVPGLTLQLRLGGSGPNPDYGAVVGFDLATLMD